MLKIYLILMLTMYLPNGEERIRMVIQETPTFESCVQLGDEIKATVEPMIDEIKSNERIESVTLNASCKSMELEVNGVTM